MEIYDLKYVDPYSAEMAILRQFGDDAQAPEVSTDPVTQQLFIRATAEQQQKIRELLIKMGETGLTLLRGRSSQNMRTVPFQGDAKAALEILKHQHGWVAKQQVQVDVEQRISITSALELAEMRVINADYSVLGGRGDGADGSSLGLEKRPVEVRDVRLPVGAERNAAGTLSRAAQVATRGVAGPDRAHSSE